MQDTTPYYQLAHDFALFTNRSIFLTGKAGTGKTTFLHNLKKATKKQMAVVAPTGVAAINAGGTTMHSFFQLDNFFRDIRPEFQHQSCKFCLLSSKVLRHLSDQLCNYAW